MPDISYYLTKEILGTKVYEWAAFLGSVGIFFAYISYCKKHPDVFDKIRRKFGLEKKIDDSEHH